MKISNPYFDKIEFDNQAKPTFIPTEDYLLNFFQPPKKVYARIFMYIQTVYKAAGEPEEGVVISFEKLRITLEVHRKSCENGLLFLQEHKILQEIKTEYRTASNRYKILQDEISIGVLPENEVRLIEI